MTIRPQKTMATFYKSFGLTEDQAMRIFGYTIANVLHNGLCKDCGKHVAETPALDATVSHVHTFTHDENQRLYVLYIIGMMIKDVMFWEVFMQNCKRNTLEETNEAVRLSLTEYRDSLKAPLN